MWVLKGVLGLLHIPIPYPIYVKGFRVAVGASFG